MLERKRSALIKDQGLNKLVFLFPQHLMYGVLYITLDLPWVNLIKLHMT